MKQIIFIGRSNVGKSTLIRALTHKKVPVGKLPGVTRKPLHIPYQNITITDMPGFGYMSRITRKGQEAIKDGIVHYIEDNADDILLAVMVVNTSSFAEIVDRWTQRNEIPVEVEFVEFLEDLNIDLIVAANKMDKVADQDTALDGIAARLGMPPPWKQWPDKLVPVSAKKGSIEQLKKLIQKKINLSQNHTDFI